MSLTDSDDAVRRRNNAVKDYRRKLLNHKELDSRIRSGEHQNPNYCYSHSPVSSIFNYFLPCKLPFLCCFSLNLCYIVYSVRDKLRNAKKDFNKTEDDLKSFQSVGQIVGEVLRPLDDQRSKINLSRIEVFFVSLVIIE